MGTEGRSPRLGVAILAAVVLALLAGGAWWLSARESPSADSATTAPVHRGAGGAAPPTLAGRPAPPIGMEAEASSNPDAVEEESPYPLAPPDGPVRVAVKYVGPGAPPAMLEIHAAPDDDYGRTLRVRLPRGTLEGRLPAAKQYSLSFWIDGWESDQSVELTVPKDLSLSVEVMVPQEQSLRIVDSATNAPVPSARAHSAQRQDRGWSLPGPDTLWETPVVADDQGRIVWSRAARVADVWVGAEGRAWTRVEVLPYDRDRLVALAPGGGLRVEVEGVTDWRALGVVVGPVPEKAPDADPDSAGDNDEIPGEGCLGATDVAGVYVAEGVPVGRWRVRVGWRGEYGLQQVLRSVETEVLGGRTSEVRVRVETAAPAWRAVTIEVVVPDSWAGAPAIRVSGVGHQTFGGIPWGDRTLTQQPAGTFQAKIERMPPGPYAVEIREFGFSRLFRVGTATTSVRIDVPPPALLRIRVLDERSGSPVPDAAVHGGSTSPFDDHDMFQDRTPDDPEGSEGSIAMWTGDAADGKRDEGTGEFTLRVPSGRTTLHVKAPGYIEKSDSIESPSAGTETRREVRLSRGGTILIHAVRAGSIALTANGQYFLDAVLVEGWPPDSPELWSGDFGGGSTRLDGLHPGKYRARLKLDGIDRELVQELDLRVGEEKTVDLELPSK